MTETISSRSPLAMLVLFMICLAIGGSIIAGLHYYTVDLPGQQRAALTMPENSAVMAAKCKNCQLDCSYSLEPVTCLNKCYLYC
ncbi:MAG: hypothetical protein GYA23_00675 [Methanomicrobiales archaeon]|nr:hypothetical protein [Methanomicrobiales archaeon]